ncbi:hypothetical protein CANINC_004831 [Pichia inconspicua]|uniref:Zn(2)-C6 fungal-type domain-containing protein n=1 Tax=Pichia inconspicua TaxID=52247 RepID=A0A4T0WV03_9ASCO|nr:hypothetical protein CANINC_004831 [[Candida] inconspicua]
MAQPHKEESLDLTRHKKGSKSGLIRNRQIYSCKRCYIAKRKCDKTHPICLRCFKTKHKCEYFSKIEKKTKKYKVSDLSALNRKTPDYGLSVEDSSIEESTFKPSLRNILNTEINPQVSKEENDNFTLVISSNGEYSKFFPTAIFPFHDHQANLSMILNFNDSETRSHSLFDFSMIIEPLDDLESIKSLIPEKNLMDFIINHFVESILPFVPIIDNQEFLYDYEQFWRKVDTFDDKNFLVLLFSIVFASCTNLMLLKVLEQLNLFEGYENNNLWSIDFEKLRLRSYQCIQNLTRMLKSELAPSISVIVGLTLVYYLGSYNGANASMQIAGLVKLSQFFGLHRSLVPTSSALPLRDVIYSFVWYLDGLNAYYSGFPPNMNHEFFQTTHHSLANSNDINIIFLRGRLQNTRIWNAILFEFNKINKTDEASLFKVEEMYSESLNQVNSINELIKHNKQACDRYKIFLMTETRMGLRKSALMIHALRNSVKNNKVVDYKENITSELTLQAILLVNESIYRVRLGADVVKKSIWFYRFAMPFQAMYIILSHLQIHPDKELNFSMLDTKYEYTMIPEYTSFDYLTGDIRLKMVDYAIGTLSFLINFWPPAQVDRFEAIVNFRNYLFDNLKGRIDDLTKNHNTKSPSEITIAQPCKSKEPLRNATFFNEFDLFDKMMIDPAIWDDSSSFWMESKN